MKYICRICGYVHEGNEPPEHCPVCRKDSSFFDKIEEGSDSLSFADEHRVGQAKEIDESIKEQLRVNYIAECTEVGMYLAMSRQADREGYPEVGDAYKRLAFEEAEHASKFCELLGEDLSSSTEENLKARMLAEKGACEGKLNLAKEAKEKNYDFVHDTVHEMCKDEARHGKVFEGLYNRYFKKED